VSGYTCTMEVHADPSLASSLVAMSSSVSASCEERVDDGWTSTIVETLDYYGPLLLRNHCDEHVVRRGDARWVACAEHVRVVNDNAVTEA